MASFLVKIPGGKLKLTRKQSLHVLINSEENSDYIKDKFGIDLSEDPAKFIYSDGDMSAINSNSFQSKVESMGEHILNLIVEPDDNFPENPRLNFDTVSFENIRDQHDIDFLRDEAIRIETYDLKKALKLMELAHKARPEGPFIKAKLMEYRAKLASH